MNRSLVLALLILTGCTPKAEELDGARADNAALDGAPKGSSDAGGDSPPALDASKASALGIVTPVGVRVIDNCEAAIAADYTSPPKMACLLFQTEDAVEPGKIDAGVFVAISDAGWKLVRVLGAEQYFERPRVGSDCAEVAVLSILTDRIQSVVDHAGAGKPASGAVWQAYAIPTSTHEACGADRMKP